MSNTFPTDVSMENDKKPCQECTSGCTGCPSLKDKPNKGVRTFKTGASRDTDEGKRDFEGFLSPEVLNTYADYMNKNRKMRDGSYRESDNWQKGIPKDQYMKSLLRHVMELWTKHRNKEEITDTPMDEILCAVMFNAMGMLYEIIQEDKMLQDIHRHVGEIE